jgi:hypothetical protein
MVALGSIVDIKANINFFNQGVMNQNMYGLYKALENEPHLTCALVLRLL